MGTDSGKVIRLVQRGGKVSGFIGWRTSMMPSGARLVTGVDAIEDSYSVRHNGAWTTLGRTESIGESDAIELKHELPFATLLGKFRVLLLDTLQGYATKSIAHIAGCSKSASRAHPSVGFSLGPCCFWGGVEHG